MVGFVDASTAEVHYLPQILTWLIMQQRPRVADATKWCDVSIQESQIIITGGFNAKGELAQSIQYKCTDNVTHTFVALHKEAQWFVKGVGGVRKSDAGLKSVNVLNMLRQQAGQGDFKPIDSEPSPAVAGSDSQTSADGDDYDPMEAMVALDSVAEAVSDKKILPRDAKSTVLACKSCRFQPDLSASTPQVKGKPPSLCTHHPMGKNAYPTYVQIVSPGFWRTQPTS